ncbi:ACP S-malonyltransferase [Kitasatospora sp. NPDC088134]|uniref:ACP S-malonyltransferase n=1 Tax=Kitasatospora sp. NPDC088134 TaxID=3364071 RepID=UPI00380A95C4
MIQVMMFPGQGGQHVGMGADLFERFPDLVREAHDVLGFPVADLCLTGPQERLDHTGNAQPALFLVHALAHRAALARGARPDVLIGHSFGEYNALEAAGALSFADALHLVRARAQATSRTPGAMTAVVGLTGRQLTAALAADGIADVYVSNYNDPRQLVLAGLAPALERAETALERAGARLVRRLNVTGPFHSPLMREAAEQFAPAVARARFRTPRVPVIANTTARPHTVRSLPRHLVAHVHTPVLWRQSLELLLRTDRPQFTQIGGGHGLIRTVEEVRLRGATVD